MHLARPGGALVKAMDRFLLRVRACRSLRELRQILKLSFFLGQNGPEKGSLRTATSAGQSSIFCIVRREKQNRCVRGVSRPLKVTGESTTRTNVEVFEGFLSAPQ
jgi:hypothetical protein